MRRLFLAVASALLAVAYGFAFTSHIVNQTTASTGSNSVATGQTSSPVSGVPPTVTPVPSVLPPNNPPTKPFVPSTKYTPPATAPQPQTVIPVPLAGNDYWVTRNYQNDLALVYGAPSDVLFLGDSITDGLAHSDGKVVWQVLYEPLGALNFAVAGARTSNVLWQVETGRVAMAAPKTIVLLIGTNDLWAGSSPLEVAAGVERITNILGAQLPDTQILLLGLLPRGLGTDDPLYPAIAQTNRLLSRLDDGARVTFLDIGHWFLTPDGMLPPALMPDGLHPNELGYLVYTVAIWEKLMELVPRE